MIRFAVILFFFVSCSKQHVAENNSVEALIGYYNKKYKEYQRVDIAIAQKYIDSIELISTKANYVHGNGTSNSTGFTIYDYLWNFDDATTQNTVDSKKKFITAKTQRTPRF